MIKVKNNLSEVIKKFLIFKQQLKPNYKNILSRLADIGVEQLKFSYSDVNVFYDGINDVKVLEPKWDGDNKVELKANGRAILFIEFGSGVTYNKTSTGADFGLYIGEYGQKKGRRKAWIYYDDKGDTVLTYGNPSHNCFYFTHETIKDNILFVLKEVFNA